MDRLTNILLFLFLLMTIGIMAWAGEPTSWVWWMAQLGFIAWACVPYAILWVLNNIVIEEEPRRDVVLLLTTVVVCGYGAWQLYNAFVVYPDELLGTVFVDMPLWQSIIAVAGGVLAYLMPKRAAT